VSNSKKTAEEVRLILALTRARVAEAENEKLRGLLKKCRPFIYRDKEGAAKHEQDKIDAKEIWPELIRSIGRY